MIIGSVRFLHIGCFDASRYDSVNFDYQISNTGQNIHVKLDTQDADSVLKLFDRKKILLPDEGLSCGFSEGIALTFVPADSRTKPTKYLIGGDECGNFVNKDTKEVINIQYSELQELFNVLRKYGANFPWILWE
jgi:hypothetical protein